MVMFLVIWMYHLLESLATMFPLVIIILNIHGFTF